MTKLLEQALKTNKEALLELISILEDFEDRIIKLESKDRTPNGGMSPADFQPSAQEFPSGGGGRLSFGRTYAQHSGQSTCDGGPSHEWVSIPSAYGKKMCSRCGIQSYA